MLKVAVQWNRDAKGRELGGSARTCSDIRLLSAAIELACPKTFHVII